MLRIVPTVRKKIAKKVKNETDGSITVTNTLRTSTERKFEIYEI